MKNGHVTKCNTNGKGYIKMDFTPATESYKTSEKFRNIFNQLQGQEIMSRDLYRSTKKELRLKKEEAEHIEKARIIAQLVAQATQSELEYKIASIVTAALETVFPEPYEFVIKFDIKRGRTEAILSLKQNNMEIDPMTGTGGGVVDVASFALRLACYLISTPRGQNTIIMDEPFRFVSTDLQPKVGELLQEMSQKLGIQFIMVTHENELKEYADLLIEF